MIERIEDMPEGAIGLRASGKLTKSDYTDVEWVAKAMHLFAWMIPGEVLIRDLDGLQEAKRWVAG